MGKTKIHPEVIALVKNLNAAIAVFGCRGLARICGVKLSTLQRISKGQNMTAEHFLILRDFLADDFQEVAAKKWSLDQAIKKVKKKGGE